jgi:hypothetical protein
MSEDRSHIDVSRRRMLKRIGAGAAIAWSAPVLTSLKVPAFAVSGPSECAQIDHCYVPCSACVYCGPPRSDCCCIPQVTNVAGCFCAKAGTCGAHECSSDADCSDVGPKYRCGVLGHCCPWPRACLPLCE